MSGTFELEGFEPISRLGGGGFGDVWLARQTNVDRQVAIKVGHSPIQDETIRLRFDRECKALGRLSGHPNIVDVYTAGSLDDGRPYLVLEYIDGGTLWQRLKKSSIPEDELIAIGTQLAAALDEAHSSGVLHRDLKPENILIRGTGEAVLGDFGIARLHDGANTTSAAITASVAYAAPEILSGKRATVASDLYGIGVCLLAAVFRSVPFVQKTDESIHPIINRVLTDVPPDVRRQGISEELAAIIDSLLSKDPSRRPASAGDLQAALGALASTRASVANPSGAGQVVGTVSELSGAQLDQARQRSPAPWSDQPATGPQPGSQPSPAWAAARGQQPVAIPPPPANTVGIPPPGGTVHDLIREPSNNIKLFAMAYIATLIVGGLAVFLAVQLLSGGDSDGQADPNTEPQAAIGVTSAPPDPSGSPALDDESSSLTGANGLGPLIIPLAAEDISFGDDAETTDDAPGPGAGTLCDKVPATEGLVDWKGQVISAGVGLRTLHQVVSRFETTEAASRYLDSYAATNDCDSWVVPTGDDGADAVVYVATEATAPAYGDQAKRFDISGELGSTLSVHARVMLIQSGTDVLSLSLSALSEAQVDELNGLTPLAAERLGYDVS